MRRLLVFVVLAVAFSVPLMSAGSPPEQVSAEASATTPTAQDRDGDNTPQPDVPRVVAAIPIPERAAAAPQAPPGRDYWIFHGDGLPEGFIEQVASIEGVVEAYPYTAGTMHLVESRKADGTVVDRTTESWVIPLDGAIVEADDLVSYLGSDLGLTEGDVVLGESAAALRGLEEGDTMTFETGSTLTVGAVVADAVFGESELIGLTASAFDADRFETRAAVIRYVGPMSRLQAALDTLYGEDAGFGLHGRFAFVDNGPRIVRSWVFLKETFGEFEYRPGRGGSVEIDPSWVEENIVEVDIPLLGTTKCHRRFAETLGAVMNLLIAEGHDSNVIDPGAFYGCWNPRYIRGTTRLSRHSFGVAADINFTTRSGNRRGSPTHEALLAAMEAYGVHSGHVWTNPDPGHFEFYGFPDGLPDEPPR